jgi:hypothetical protein
MTDADGILAALALPAEARLDQRIPKKLLVENGAPTAADRRAITDGIAELVWVAALKPTTIGVPAFRDETREYLEIAVLRLGLRPAARRPRLTELVHRAVPYPVLLVTDQAGEAEISTAGKRRAQTEAAKTVLDGTPMAVVEPADGTDGVRATFRRALALDRQPQACLRTLYEGWEEALLALRVAKATGAFAMPAATRPPADRREALAACARLDAEIARLRAAGARERQMARRVALNLEIGRLQAARDAAQAKL